MVNIPELLTRIERKRLWTYFHKDWLLQIRELLRPQLPRELAIFVESEAVVIAPGSMEAAALAPDVAIARRDHDVLASRTVEQVSAMVLEVEEEIELYETYSLLIRRRASAKNRVGSGTRPQHGNRSRALLSASV